MITSKFFILYHLSHAPAAALDATAPATGANGGQKDPTKAKAPK